MMQQYLEIKEAHKDAVLFFRLGDFYEMFFEDAVEMSRELELTLTGRDCGLTERAPMCGVPYHAVDQYIAKLVGKGYKVAICEQMTDPADSKGLVERAVTRIITPGTVIEASLLDERAASFILAVCVRRDRAGMAFCDLSTGEFYAHEFSGAAQILSDELSKIDPREILTDDPEALSRLGAAAGVAVTRLDEGSFDYGAASRALFAHFHVKNTAALGLDGMRLAVSAAGALIGYLTQTQKNALSHILEVRRYERELCMQIDRIAAASLELTGDAAGKARRVAFVASGSGGDFDGQPDAQGLDRAAAVRQGRNRRAAGRGRAIEGRRVFGGRASGSASRRVRHRTPAVEDRLRHHQRAGLSGAGVDACARAAAQRDARALRSAAFEGGQRVARSAGRCFVAARARDLARRAAVGQGGRHHSGRLQRGA